ncbi:MAG TPA: hypothetical protein VMV03_13655, partial [Spirochaetia bacterium]|nr:hypothetical protein [Spirochaetia bacterium]
PSAADVTKAFQGMSLSQQQAPAPNSAAAKTAYQTGPYTPTITVGGGSIAVSYTATGNPSGPGPWSVAGTLTLTNVYDSYSGYTFNGTINISASFSDPAASQQTTIIVMTGSLSLSGGTISTLGCNITITSTIPPSGNPVTTGTITADGFTYDVTKL